MQKYSILCTFEHPFFVNDGWIEAKELRAGDSLLAFDGNKIAIDSIYSFRTDTATVVYNFEVSGNHNYYVSARGVLVHNECKIPSLNQIQNMISKGQKPQSIVRLDFTNLGIYEKPHITFQNTGKTKHA